MGLSLWECEAKDCKRTAVGTGGAIGLRAIGWYFRLGPVIFCPTHRPDPVPCHDRFSAENHGNLCSECAGQDEADAIQTWLGRSEDSGRLT